MSEAILQFKKITAAEGYAAIIAIGVGAGVGSFNLWDQHLQSPPAHHAHTEVQARADAVPPVEHAVQAGNEAAMVGIAALTALTSGVRYARHRREIRRIRQRHTEIEDLEALLAFSSQR